MRGFYKGKKERVWLFWGLLLGRDRERRGGSWGKGIFVN